MFSCNLTPALLAKWLTRIFYVATAVATGVEPGGYQNKTESAQKIPTLAGEENSPAGRSSVQGLGNPRPFTKLVTSPALRGAARSYPRWLVVSVQACKLHTRSIQLHHAGSSAQLDRNLSRSVWPAYGGDLTQSQVSCVRGGADLGSTDWIRFGLYFLFKSCAWTLSCHWLYQSQLMKH